MIKAIVCVDNNWAIGNDNELLFHLPKDMNFFRITTQDKVVVCGRKTLESFPGNRPLQKRSTICLCSPENNREDCYCVNSFYELLKLVKELAKTQDIFIIGGAQLYKAFLPYYDEVLVTKVSADGHGTVFFPNLDDIETFVISTSTASYPDGEYLIQFLTYKRKVS